MMITKILVSLIGTYTLACYECGMVSASDYVSEAEWKEYLSLNEEDAFQLCLSWCLEYTEEVSNPDNCELTDEAPTEDNERSFYCSGIEECR